MTTQYIMVSVMSPHMHKNMENVIETMPIDIDESKRADLGFCNCGKKAYAKVREMKIYEILVPDYALSSFERKMKYFTNTDNWLVVILSQIPILRRIFRGWIYRRLRLLLGARNFFIYVKRDKLSKTTLTCRTCKKGIPSNWN